MTSDAPVQIAYTLLADMVPVVKVGDIVKPKMVLAKMEGQKGNIKATDDAKVKSIQGSIIITQTEGKVTKVYPVPSARTVIIKSGDQVEKGQPLTNGHLDLRQLMLLKNEYAVQKYIMTEVQSIYASQGQSINDKHIEIIAKQMLSKIRILEGGDSKFLPGEIVDIIKLSNANAELKKNKKKEAKGERLLLGLTRIALYTESWLSAASFQETIRVLVEASTTSRIDKLEGLKENVIIGKLIPAGETYRKRHLDKMAEVKEENKIEVVESEEEIEEALPVI